MKRFMFALVASIGLCGQEEVRAAFVTLGGVNLDGTAGDSQVTSPFNPSTTQAQQVHEGSLFPEQATGTQARTGNRFRNTSPYGGNDSPHGNDFRTETATTATLTSSFVGNYGEGRTTALGGASAQTFPPSGDPSGSGSLILFTAPFVDAPTGGESFTAPFFQPQPIASDVTIAPDVAISDREGSPLSGGTGGTIGGAHTPTATFVDQQDVPISQSEADVPPPVTANPAPSSVALLGIGGAFGLLGHRLRRRKAESLTC